MQRRVAGPPGDVDAPAQHARPSALPRLDLPRRGEAADRVAMDRRANRAEPGGLPQPLRAGIEALSGLDMGDVRVHHDSPQPAAVNALAYAQGDEIHLGPGQAEHLPHEAWHVVQQKQGRVAADPQHKGGINGDAALEREADEMGARALVTPGGTSVKPRRTTSTGAAIQRKTRRSEGLIGEFGDTYRELDLNPDKNVESFTRWDDAPIDDEFRVAFNKLENWQIYVQSKHVDLVPALAACTSPEGRAMADRSDYVGEVKAATKRYKQSIRNLADADARKIRATFEQKVQALVADMKALDQVVHTWFEQTTQPELRGDQLGDHVSREGNRLWRESWKDAIYEVNRILAAHWPALKQDLQQWVDAKRGQGLHLPGEIGELTYIGSLAKGYKGPPKQHVRFNPDKFDVDASLDAPPIARFATEHKQLKPDKGKIFGHELYQDIPALRSRSAAIDEALDAANVVEHDDDEPFEIAFPARDTEGQRNQYSGSAGLSLLRDHLPANVYQMLLEDEEIAPLLQRGEQGTALGEIDDEQYAKLRTRLLSHLGDLPEEQRPALREVLRQNMVKDFGDEYRKDDIEPNKDVHSYTRWDDAPIHPDFRQLYNKLENWVIYIKTKHPHLSATLQSQVVGESYSIDDRANFVRDAKEATRAYKSGIRDLSDHGATERVRETFDLQIAGLVKDMRALDAHVLEWFGEQDEAGQKKGKQLADHVDEEGTNLWREAFKDKVYEVNRILASKWPTLKAALEIWVREKRTAGLFLPGEVGELTYIGSLAKGYKGPPKQHVRFNPEKFDVDASLDAPPIARFATEHKKLKPDKGKIFGHALYDDIPKLRKWSEELDTLLDDEGVVEKDENEPFEIAFPAKETPEQINQYSGSSALSTLRGIVGHEVYQDLLADEEIAPMLRPSEGKALAEIDDGAYETLRGKILQVVKQHCDERAVRKVAHILRKS